MKQMNEQIRLIQKYNEIYGKEIMKLQEYKNGKEYIKKKEDREIETMKERDKETDK